MSELASLFSTPPLTEEVLGVPVTLGPLPAPWDAELVGAPRFWVDPYRVLFRAFGSGVYIADGDTVILDASPEARPSIDWMAYSLAARTLLIQQHRFHLHAALVTSPAGETVAVMGRPMAGKSTTTIELLRRGWSMACDDIVEVDFTGGTATARPIARPVHLSESAAELIGLDPATGTLLAGGRKRAWQMDADLSPRRLTAIVWLSAEHSAQGVTATRIGPVRALPLVGKAANGDGVCLLPSHRPAFLQWTSTLTARVPLTEVLRPTAGDTVDQVADAIEASALRRCGTPRTNGAL